VTSSIEDKVTSVLGFLLEQILRVLNPIADTLSSILTGIMGWFSGGANVAQGISGVKSERKHLNDYISKDDTNRAQKMATLDAVESSVTDGISQGLDGNELIKSASGSFDANKMSSMNDEELEKMIKFVTPLTGNKLQDSGVVKSRMGQFRAAKGDTTEMLKALGIYGTAKNAGSGIMRAGSYMAGIGMSSPAAQARLDRQKTRADKKTDPKTVAAEKARIEAANETKGKNTNMKSIAYAEALGENGSGAPGTVSASGASNVPGAGGTAESIAKSAEAQQQNAEAALREASDTNSSLEKGLILDQGWLNSKYKAVIKEATLDSFRTALMEFAIIEAKSRSSEKFGGFLADHGADALSRGKNMGSFMGIGKDDSKAMTDMLGGFATGGSVPYDQVANVHKGEFVVPKGGALIGAGGGKTVNMGGVTINVSTDADPHQIARVVHDMHRQH
jgi:hypothetical protein